MTDEKARFYVVRKPIVILGEQYSPGDIVDFDGVGVPKNFIESGFLKAEEDESREVKAQADDTGIQ